MENEGNLYSSEQGDGIVLDGDEDRREAHTCLLDGRLELDRVGNLAGSGCGYVGRLLDFGRGKFTSVRDRPALETGNRALGIHSEA